MADSVRKSLKLSMISKYLEMTVNFALVVMVARLLSPAEVGVFAIASALVLLAAQVKSFGMGSYLIKSAKLDKELVQKALGIMLLLSWGIAFVLIISSNAIQRFYDVEGIQIVLLLLSISFFTAPFSGIHRSLLSKEFRFTELAVISVTSQLVNFVLTFILINQGFSFYSMAIATAIAALLELVLLLSIKIEFKTLLPSFSGSRDMLKFGAFSTLTSMINKGINVLPDLVLGRLGTTLDVALYSRANGLTGFVTGTIMGGIRPVSLPYLSKKNNQYNDLEQGYLLANNLSGSLLAPVLLVLGLSSYFVILFLFGEKWVDSAEIAFYYCIAQSIYALSILSEVPFTVRGLMHLTFYRVLFRLVLTFICIVSQYSNGLPAIAFGFIFVNLIDYFINVGLMKTKLGFSARKLMGNSFKTISVCLICATGYYLISLPTNYYQVAPYIMVLAVAVVMPPIWYATTQVLRLPIGREINRMLWKKN